MKIAYDYQIFSSQQYGGISRYIFELANHLACSGDGMINCLINSPVYVNKYLDSSSHDLHIKGISVPAIPRTGRIRSSLNRLLSPLAFNGWQPDILHETFYSPISVAPPGSRIVITVYDMIHELHPEYYSVHDRTTEYKKIAVERADHVICISENTRKDLIRLLDVPPHKTTVVHLGFTFTEGNMFNLPPPKRPFILYLGGRWGYKNFKRLLVAYSSRPELLNCYDLVAFGGGNLTSKEVAMIQSLHIPLQQVRQVSGDDRVLSAFFNQADMFVYPSLYEGFGIPPLEAMSFNCPVVCSNISSIPEVVGDAAIYFDPYDTKSIADALVNLFLDPALRRSLIDRGNVRLREFSWEQCAMQTLDVYRALLK